MAQIPPADKGKNCPLYKLDMSKVCHKCAWWTKLRGKNPQSNEEVDEWGCAIAWLPMLMIEGAQMSRQTGAAVESFRNEVVKRSDANAMNAAIAATPTRRLKTIQG
jgi:hypothetical protein